MIYIFLILTLLVLIGFHISNQVEDRLLAVLFWFMYIISVFTLTAIVSNIYFIYVIKDKSGPPGSKGLPGSKGDVGDDGVCDVNCNDERCYKEILDFSQTYVNKIFKKPIKFNNMYLKERIKMICQSKDFYKLVDIKGRKNVMDYVKSTLAEWYKLLAKAGNAIYFEGIGSETEFEWKKQNPWDEIKKYDMYYWDMSPIFKVNQVKKCSEAPKPTLFVIKTNSYKLSVDIEDCSFWHPDIIENSGVVYYPMGSIYKNIPSKKIPCNGMKQKDSIMYESVKCEGPDDITVLVSGDVKAPIGSTLIYALENKYKVYRLIPPENYISMGDVVIPFKDDINNYLQIYKCVPASAVEPIGGGNVTINKLSKFVIHMPPDKWHQTESYNLFRGRFEDLTDDVATYGMYRIKKESLESQMPLDNKDNGGKPIYSRGFIDKPVKDAKYSVLNYLGLPSSGVCINVGNNRIFIYIKQKEGQNYDHYYIYGYENGSNNSKILKATSSNQCTWVTSNGLTLNDSYEWIINTNQNDLGYMTIKNAKHSTYLRISSTGEYNLVYPNFIDKNAYWITS